jgi:hypothetical protein
MDNEADEDNWISVYEALKSAMKTWIITDGEEDDHEAHR